ncbi:hypothetical protein, conserved [Leishmania tarentolae]|uniref:PIN domain-containing protein n=1 Tax=Leishmania tarentolae TaxID=5689 RepID=A0A640KCU5_LEITA|nr:hypothetical protein, conserved [Leishmania tarentolae]
MYQPSTSKRRRRALSGKPRQKPKKEEQETSASEKESAQPAPTSSTPNAGTSGSDGGNGKTRQRRTRRWSGQSRAQSDEGFSYLRAATVAPERARSPASTSTRLGRKGDTLSQELAPAPSPKAPDSDTIPWPPVPQPLMQASIASFPNRSTPAESSLARLRALAGLTPLRMSSYDPQTLPSSLYRNEESPLRHSCDANSTFGGSDSSSTASSCVSSPYTPDLVRRLSFLNGTSAQTTLALLRGDRLKRRRSGEHKLPSPSLGPSFHNEEENAVRPLKGLPGVPTTSDTAASAGRSPFLTPSLCFTDLRDSTSSLYRNEEDTDRDHRTDTERSSARLAPSLLSRLRASSPCLTPAAESGSDPYPYMTPQNGGSAVGETQAPRELPTQSPWRSAATRLAARPLAEPSTSPGMGVSQPSDMSARLAQLRERASTPSTVLPSGATAGPSSAVGTASAKAPPQKTHFLDLSHLRGLTNLQQPHAQPSGQRSDVQGDEGREKGPSPAPAAARETALECALQHRLLAGATAAPVDTTPTPPAAIDSDEPFLGPAEGMQQRAERRHKSENVLTSSDHSTKENYNHTDAKASVRRAPSQKGAVRTTAKKESAAAAVVPKGRLAKGTRGSNCHTSTVIPSTAPKDKVSPAAVEGVVPCSSCSGRAKQVMNKLRSLAAPVPIGETAGEEKLKAVPNPFPVSAAASPVPSLLKHISQRPPSLEPNTAEKAHLRRNMSVLPPSWTSASPFAALASPSLHVALTKASADFAEERGTTGSADDGDGVSDGEVHPKTPSSSPFTSVSPNYSYPSMMTRSAAVAAAKVTSATPTVAATSTAGMACVSSEAKTRTATTRVRTSSRDMKCVVFDTSSLLDSEPGVMSLLLERWFVGIPFTVLDELDRMHKACGGGGGGGNGKSDHATATAAASTAAGNSTHDREWRRQRAHELRNWIAACLNNETQSHLLLQKRTEVIREYDRHATTNDDRILGYAVYLSQSQSAEVLFVTEDKFLRIKASSELGKAYAYTDVRKLVGMPPLPTVTPSASQRRTAKR